MTKIFKLSILFLIFSTCFFLFSQEIEDVFDFDDLFANAEDVEAIVEEEKIQKIDESQTKNTKNESQKFNFSGLFTANAAILAQYPKDPYYLEAGAKLSNTLNFSAKASSALSFHASIYTDEKSITKPKEALELKSFYFDYLAFDRLLLTAGKKSYDWGNPLYFSSNVLSDFGENISFQLVYPLYPIDILFLGKYNAPITDSMDPKKLDLAFALETSFLGINAKAFSRYWSASKENEIKKIVFGLEWKRDILGLDFYQQALYYFHLPSLSEWNPNSFQLISGLAQIWDGKYKIYGGKGQAIDILAEFEHNMIIPPCDVGVLVNAIKSSLLNEKTSQLCIENQKKIKQKYLREDGAKLLVTFIEQNCCETH